MKKKDFIAEDLLSKIYQKKYLPKHSLPSERKLTNEYNVSRNTIRKALSKLVDIGVIQTIPGKGHIVRKNFNSSSLIYSSITEKKAKQIDSKVLSLTKRTMSKKEKNIFDEQQVNEVWEIKRLRIVDQKVMEIQESILPRNLFPYIDKVMAEGSLQQLILDVGLSISHSLANFEAVNLSETEARLLHEKKNHAAMKVTSRTISTKGTILEYTTRIVIDYTGTFKLPFSKLAFNHRHI